MSSLEAIGKRSHELLHTILDAALRPQSELANLSGTGTGSERTQHYWGIYGAGLAVKLDADMPYVRCGAVMLVACGLSALAEVPGRPDCTKERVGRMWPEEANDNPKFAAALMPYGYPQVCTFRDGRYKWHSFTVPVQQLKKSEAPKKQRPNREATPEK